MRLSGAETGKCYIVESIQLPEDKKRRILDLGITENAKITVENLKTDGPMIISVRGTRLALGRKFSDGIIVWEMKA